MCRRGLPSLYVIRKGLSVDLFSGPVAAGDEVDSGGKTFKGVFAGNLAAYDNARDCGDVDEIGACAVFVYVGDSCYRVIAEINALAGQSGSCAAVEIGAASFMLNVTAVGRRTDEILHEIIAVGLAAERESLTFGIETAGLGQAGQNTRTVVIVVFAVGGIAGEGVDLSGCATASRGSLTLLLALGEKFEIAHEIGVVRLDEVGLSPPY